MDKITAFGAKLNDFASGIFASEDDFDSELFDETDSGGERDFPRGSGYQLSFMHYKNPELHSQPYFLTSQLGAPFPSSHANPLPTFPSRWTEIKGVVDPCENITAPRIRLGPQELNDKWELLSRMAESAHNEKKQPAPRTLNLSHQCMGDVYQLEALKAFLAMNKEVQILNLNDNEIEDLHETDLDCVVKLHLSHNNIVTFGALPPLPNCEELYLANNFISSLDGLNQDKFPKLKRLHLAENPIHHLAYYFDMILKAVPQVAVIDGVDVN